MNDELVMQSHAASGPAVRCTPPLLLPRTATAWRKKDVQKLLKDHLRRRVGASTELWSNVYDNLHGPSTVPDSRHRLRRDGRGTAVVTNTGR